MVGINFKNRKISATHGGPNLRRTRGVEQGNRGRMGLTLLIRPLFAGDCLPYHQATPRVEAIQWPQVQLERQEIELVNKATLFWPQVLIVPLGVRSVSDVDITWVQAGCVGSFLLFFYLLEVCLKINICCLHLLP